MDIVILASCEYHFIREHENRVHPNIFLKIDSTTAFDLNVPVNNTKSLIVYSRICQGSKDE